MDSKQFTAAVTAYEKTDLTVAVTVNDRTLRFATPSQTCLWRAMTLTTKEPDTLGWIDSCPEGAVFLDIGANVGVYTVYAGVTRGATVYAFEPEAQNYAVLCRNIALNGLGQRAVAWCAALSDEQKFDRIHVAESVVGGSTNSFGEQIDPYLRERKFTLSQGCYATTIDALVEARAMEVPAFIKIDVDGLEHKIIRGAERTLKNGAVQSLLVEINSSVPEHMQIVDFLAAIGFRHDPQQFARAQRKEGYFKGVGEYVFRR